MMFMGFGFFLFFLLVVVAVFLFDGRRFNLDDLSLTSNSGQEKSAMEIARKRYARGEIDKETFEQLRHDLSG